MNETRDVQRRGTEFFVSWKDRAKEFALAPAELKQIVQAADAMIPGGGGWPRPSDTEMLAYIREGARRAADVALLREALQAVGAALNDGAVALEAQLSRLRTERPLAFRVLQEFVYYAYYAQPEVVRAVRELLDCDYISPPQPHGYAMPPDAGIVPSRGHTYVPTHEVRRVDLSGVDLQEQPRPGDQAC
jgi:hypothetical protein